MNYKDVALLNGSLDSLSESLLKQRVLEQQAADKQQQFGIEQGRVDVDRARADALNQHYVNQGTALDAATKEKAKANTLRTWGDTVKMFGGWVKDGIVDPQTAQDKLSQAYDAMPDPLKEALADHPAVKAIQDGEPVWKAPPIKPIHPPAVVATEAQARTLEDEATAMDETDPEGAQRRRAGAQILRDSIRKNPPRLNAPPAAVATLDAAKGMRDKANGLREEDPEGAKQLDSYAELLEGHIKKTLPTAPVLRKSVTTKKDSAGNATTISGQADQVDAALKGSAGAPKAGEVRKGYRFKGGDPAKQENWEKVK